MVGQDRMGGACLHLIIFSGGGKFVRGWAGNLSPPLMLLLISFMNTLYAAVVFYILICHDGASKNICIYMIAS